MTLNSRYLLGRRADQPGIDAFLYAASLERLALDEQIPPVTGTAVANISSDAEKHSSITETVGVDETSTPKKEQ